MAQNIEDRGTDGIRYDLISENAAIHIECPAPGSFNVPAYYGRGINASLTAGIKMPHSRLYLRMGHMNYLNPKPDRLECKLQWTLRL